MKFKPLLAGKVSDVNKLTYPCFVAAKIDGVRAIVIDGRVMSRSLKEIPNGWVQRTFGFLPSGTDGELVFANPVHKDAYRNTVSAVMREDGEPTGVCFHAFDNYLYAGGFQERFERLKREITGKYTNVQVVPHSLVQNSEELQAVEEIAVAAGWEGVMVRSPIGKYKFGRSTENEGILLKLKRFSDINCVITGSYEWLNNNNQARTNALGRTERSSHQENKVGAGVLGGFHVKGLEQPYMDVEFDVGTGFQGADAPDGERASLWNKRDKLVGMVVKVQYFPLGSLNKPRFPTFRGFRDERDL